jgi:adenosylmethionine-8-amino-7-oxononanoate aminotransferase
VIERERHPRQRGTCPRTAPAGASCSNWANGICLIGDVRGVGLMACLELVSDRATKAAFARGDETPGQRDPAQPIAMARLMLRVSGSNVVLLAAAGDHPRGSSDLLVDAIDAAFIGLTLPQIAERPSPGESS